MYPKDESLYRNVFIHRRVIEYVKRGLDIEVFVLDEGIKETKIYFFEGVKVIEGNKISFIEYTSKKKPTKILIHFINRHMIDGINSINEKIGIIVWIHLMEAIGWYRRLFNYKDGGFIKYILQNTRQMLNLRKFIKKSSERDIKFIFVSNWIKNTTQKDTFTKINNFEIIHNVVDTNLFQYEEKDLELRKKILLIRPFESRKYANDVAVEAILKLKKKSYFDQLEFSIFGSGQLFEKTVSPIRHLENVKIHNTYLKHNEIKDQHSKHGIFLCPTRQDSQGVSMCEAMSSGLVPITSKNSAIPEFVEHKFTGLITQNAEGIVKEVDYLYNNPLVFSEISKNASSSMFTRCSPEKVINEEVKVIINE